MRSISVFGLAMINVAAIGSVKNWSFIAEYGLTAVFFLLLAAVIFFLPVSLVAAELATAWPKEGGVYFWVREAFGHRMGLLAIWLLWIENVAWYPTILSFTSATIAYIFNPALSENVYYTVIVVLVLFWTATLTNLFGMKMSSWISDFGAICGTFIPGILIIILGLFWYFGKNTLQISFDLSSLAPQFKLDYFIFFTGVLLALAGMEMSAVHARDVQQPQKNYPRAIFLSAFFILFLSVLGVLSIAMVIPKGEISLVAGSMQAISVFMSKYHLMKWVPFIAALIAIGSFGSLSTWIIGPSKGLLAAAEGGDFPKIFQRTNRHHVPTMLLLAQGIIATVLTFFFLLMPTVSSGFWMFTVLVAQLYLIMYLLLFAAAIRLRYTKLNVARPYRIPGGKLGLWLIGGIGILSCLFALFIGFIPPQQVTVDKHLFYFLFLLIGILIACLFPFFFLFPRKKSL